VTAYPTWTPASRPGIIPLRPLTFGTILGRSFAALRQNPRVLLGFALCVQTAGYLLVLVGVGAVAIASFTRLDTLREGTEEFDAVLAGSVALTLIAGVVLGLGAAALGVIVQGVVVSEVAHAAVAEKLPLRGVWQRVKPVAWRLIGYAFLLSTAVFVLIAIVAGLLVVIGVAALPVAVGLTILVVLAAIPLSLWLSTKLLLAPAAIILEHATIGQAIARSWVLTRGRFWPILGIIVIVSLVFGAIAQAVSLPFSFLSSALTTIITPTGASEVSAIIGLVVAGLLTQVVTLLIQSVAVVVQATATAIIYIDCRMRREGLDIDLLTYVERRDAGAAGLADPYREHVGRVIAPRPAPPSWQAGPQGPIPGRPYGAPVSGPPPAYGAPAYGGPPAPGAPPAYPPPAHGSPPVYAPPVYAPPAYAPPPAYSPSGAPVTPPYAPPAETRADEPREDATTQERPAPTRWTAPGSSPGAADPGSP
jgi:MFS family permease